MHLSETAHYLPFYQVVARRTCVILDLWMLDRGTSESSGRKRLQRIGLWGLYAGVGEVPWLVRWRSNVAEGYVMVCVCGHFILHFSMKVYNSL